MTPSEEPQVRRVEASRNALRIALAIVYLVAGIAHLRLPCPFVRIAPEWVPMPELVVAATGVAEILGAIALLFVPSLRRAAGIAFALYAICVFPANFKHAVEGIDLGGFMQGWAYHGPRLAFQPVFVWWALFAVGIIDWPWDRRSRQS